jgi:hypothetical protein
VCASREYDPRLTSQRLGELSGDEAHKLLVSLGVPLAFRDAVIDFTGIPRCLELAARYSQLPDASPAVFCSYDASTDDASLVTDYIRESILDRLKGMKEYGKYDRIRGVADLLEYGCVLTEVTPALVAHTLGTTEPFNRYLSDGEFVQELLGDRLLKAHLVDAIPPYFHDLIRSLAVSALRREEDAMYTDINRKAAKYYAQQLTARDGGAGATELLQGEFPLVLTTAHLHDQGFSDWRRTFLKFYQHLCQANPPLGIKLAQHIFQKVFCAHCEPFCERILQEADATTLSPTERAWLLTKRAAARCAEPEKTLEEVLRYDMSEIGREVWAEAATRLMHVYLAAGKLQPAQV